MTDLTPRQQECAHAASTTSRGERFCDRCGLRLPLDAGPGPDGEGHVDQTIRQRRR